MSLRARDARTWNLEVWLRCFAPRHINILQAAEWSKPRGFSHGVEFSDPGRWVVLAGQTGGDEDYVPDMAAQVASALKRIVKLLGEAVADMRILRMKPFCSRLTLICNPHV
jgi:enamine deaminase RidA (YjgF/YER057c/UK114 family)